MGRDEIQLKLNERLSTIPLSEDTVVYILSRVRKILEFDNNKSSYSALNFYCNLALHSNINRIPDVTYKMLMEIKDGTNYANSIIGFEDFHKEFKRFLKKNNLSDSIYTDISKLKIFNKLLRLIYSNTPITIELKEVYKVTLDNKGNISFFPKEED